MKKVGISFRTYDNRDRLHAIFAQLRENDIPFLLTNPWESRKEHYWYGWGSRRAMTEIGNGIYAEIMIRDADFPIARLILRDDVNVVRVFRTRWWYQNPSKEAWEISKAASQIP